MLDKCLVFIKPFVFLKGVVMKLNDYISNLKRGEAKLLLRGLGYPVPIYHKWHMVMLQFLPLDVLI